MTTDRHLAEPVVAEPLTLPPSSLETITRSELDVQIGTAHRYPRSLALFKSNALTMIRLDQETAAACYYSLPRKKADGSTTRIEGPSVRLAEIVSSAWGNLRAGGRVIAETDREIVAQGYAHDLQSNYAVVTEVRRRIVDREGRRYSDDMVGVTANAACAIARRNAVLAVIPRAYVNPLVDVARKVAGGDLNTLREGRARAVQAFAELHVTAAQLCDKVGRPGVEDLDLQDLSDLAGLLTALRDGETTVAAEFPAPAGEAASAGDQATRLRNRVRARRSAAAAPAAAAESTPEDPEPGAAG
jgi:hypothetical protein